MAQEAAKVEGSKQATEHVPAESVSSETVAVAMGILKSVGGKNSTVLADIEKLAALEKEKRAERKAAATALRNAQRRKHRLKHKARLLSAEDLKQVMCLRICEEETSSKRQKKDKKKSVQPGSPAAKSTSSASELSAPVVKECEKDPEESSDPELSDGKRS